MDSPAAHLAAVKGQLDAALSFGLDVPFVTAHTGHDSFTDGAAADVLGGADELASSLGVTLLHETHRGRVAGSPWLLARLLPQLSSLKLCADYSHFTAACEVSAAERDEALDSVLTQLAPRVRHMHARVGDECRAQVHDPRDRAAHGADVDGFNRWWRHIWAAQRDAGLAQTSVTAEYGPPPYSSAATVDYEAVNAWTERQYAQAFQEWQADVGGAS